jgi:mannose-6-phosphate isomerase-like protein (cupin superfamily)
MELSTHIIAPKLQGEKSQIFTSVKSHLASLGFHVVATDFTRPWGGFLVIDEMQAEKFAAHYFPGIEIGSLKITGKLSPKILMVEPGKKLSWQYHNRRSEIWKLVIGEGGIVRGKTDELTPAKELAINEIIRLVQGERHRLVGLKNWGMIAEIWQHTDFNHPSDEEDIIRVQDDFGR